MCPGNSTGLSQEMLPAESIDRAFSAPIVIKAPCDPNKASERVEDTRKLLRL